MIGAEKKSLQYKQQASSPKFLKSSIFSVNNGFPHQIPQTLDVCFFFHLGSTGWVVSLFSGAEVSPKKHPSVKPTNHSSEMSSQQKNRHRPTKKSLGILKWKLGNVHQLWGIYQTPSENKKSSRSVRCADFESLGGFKWLPGSWSGSLKPPKKSRSHRCLSNCSPRWRPQVFFSFQCWQICRDLFWGEVYPSPTSGKWRLKRTLHTN